MGVTQQINDDTSFVLNDGTLIPIEEAEEIENAYIKEARDVRSPQLGEDEAWMRVPSFIKEREGILYTTIVQHVLESVDTYLRVKEEQTTEFAKQSFYKNLSLDMKTSGLLQRLLSGKAPLATPPPKSFDTGWYDLVEDGEDVCIDVVIVFPYTNYQSNYNPEPYATIDGKQWDVIEGEKDSDDYVVQFPKDTDTYRLSRMTAEDYPRLLHPRLRKAVTKNGYAWKLTKLEQENGE